ncbi:uncharacterized protein EAE98_009238 [Botrytis deweyae]|uniref:Lpxtg-domain-containing protein n=1 Tax=Botrytis deweyae TaxID=2478750 RepID=A0ABQ7ICI2_9HELO|nr:uncharacterized protein EAE98_009238 [Botrytis deweyae]KAF7920004.1 hypothetical protein EAE98_009238 [Botrytis deweyae]
MRSSILAPSLFLITSFTQSTSALKALPDSPCASKCGNVLGGTSGENDIVCQNTDYTSLIGTTYSGCVGCQLTSTFVDPSTNETDLEWGLYNLRYAMSWCLFGFPNNTDVEDTPCITSLSCAPMKNAIEYGNLTTDAQTEYGYCSDIATNQIAECQNCLEISRATYYLNNFYTLLYGACDQQPAPGSTLSFQGSPFSTTQLNMTSPTPTAVPGQTYSGLSLNARIGVAVGIIVFALFITGFCIVFNGRRRRRRVLRQHQLDTGYAAWKNAHDVDGLGGHIPVNEVDSAVSNMTSGSGGFFDSPNSQKPLQPNYWGQQQPHGGNFNGPAVMTPIEDSPITPMAEKVYLSPYSSPYSSPATASTDANGRSPNIDQWPMDRKGSFGQSSFGQGGGSMAEKLKARERERARRKKEEEAMNERNQIELQNMQHFQSQNVAPVLGHPGYGRDRDGVRGLSSEDARRGDAL